MSPGLFNVYTNDLVGEVNAMGVLERAGHANSSRFEIQPLIADNTSLLTDSGKKLCRLVILV